MARMNNRPASMSARTSQSENGTTAQAAKAGIKVSIGASTNRNLFALLGMMISFSNSLNTSANGWNRPFGPTRFGPTRACMKPITLRSA